MVNASLVWCVSNGGRMKAKFTIVKPSEKAWFIARLSTLCLFRWHLVMNFEKHFVTLLNFHAPTISWIIGMNLFIQKSMNANLKTAILRIWAMTKYANESFAQNVLFNLTCHFTCDLEFPHPAVLLYLPVAIQTRWIQGHCRDRICLGEKSEIKLGSASATISCPRNISRRSKSGASWHTTLKAET